MANIKDIAAKVGVSNTAVSKYLRDPNTTHVSAELKQKIDTAVEELHYRRHVIAQSLSSRKTNIISILIPFNAPFSRSTFLNEVLSGLESVFLNNGYHMIFLATQGDDSTSMVKYQIAQGYGFDGAVLFNSRYCKEEDTENNVKELQAAKVPFVVVNSPSLNLEINQVVFSTPESGSAVKFLLGQGHERIAFMGGREGTAVDREEIQQYRLFHQQARLAIDEELILYGDYERGVAKGAMLQFLQKRADFSAVYCISDTMALGVYEALKERGLQIPEDISVVGKHDSFFASYLNPPLTTVR
ncbi:MAG: LacI family transcriptional regulator, partial [bacterium]|nr:LacI family transcriptional regulator [bacterium]